MKKQNFYIIHKIIHMIIMTYWKNKILKKAQKDKYGYQLTIGNDDYNTIVGIQKSLKRDKSFCAIPAFPTKQPIECNTAKNMVIFIKQWLTQKQIDDPKKIFRK